MHFHIDRLTLQNLATVLVVSLVWHSGDRLVGWLIPAKGSHGAAQVASAPPPSPGESIYGYNDPGHTDYKYLGRKTELVDTGWGSGSSDIKKPDSGSSDISTFDSGSYNISRKKPTVRPKRSGMVKNGNIETGSVTNGYVEGGSITEGYLGSGTITDGTYGSTLSYGGKDYSATTNLGGGYDYRPVNLGGGYNDYFTDSDVVWLVPAKT